MPRYGFTRVYELPRIRARCRTAALRQAFLGTMKDKDFLADAEQAKLEIMPVEGAQIQRD